MCRCQGQVLTDKMRPAILEHLAGELALNHAAFRMSPPKLILVTLYHGAVGQTSYGGICNLRRHTMDHRKCAAVNYPTDPRWFLRDVIKTIWAIEAESQQPGNEFAIFDGTPGHQTCGG